jgi:bacteriocin biosynthesis cyclodehydratase domain-containing protein
MRPVHVLSAGDFGRAVAARMGEMLEIVVTEVRGHGVSPASWPLARLHILASWRPALSISRQVEASAFAWRVPWLPIVAEHPFIYIGPSIVPGVGPCYGCFRRRLMQHSGSNDLTDALQTHYENDPEAGPQGYLPTLATFSAMVACDIAERIAHDPANEAGKVSQLHVPSLRTLQGLVVGVHGCERCGSGRDERTRSHAELEKDLARLFRSEP